MVLMSSWQRRDAFGNTSTVVLSASKSVAASSMIVYCSFYLRMLPQILSFSGKKRMRALRRLGARPFLLNHARTLWEPVYPRNCFCM
ncbi:unnamed protein product [Amoebophrya sp. A25]|nr:unnamed protein product [Amoebophrya sp. A25]|eukprot:GSA25T00025624001.1